MPNLADFSNSHKQTRALLSIKPQFVDAILRGEKRFEFRRTTFSRKVDVVVIYATSPVKRVIAEFDVVDVIKASLPKLWRQTKDYAGIDKEFFFKYFDGLDKGNAIEIGEVRRYDTPFCPTDVLGLKPPQSYAYLNPNTELCYA